MPGASKKRGKKLTPKKRIDTNSPDNVTINDFANSPSGNHARLKKASSSGPNVASCGDPHDECEAVVKSDEASKLRERKPRRGSKLDKSSKQNQGTDYPLDLWFLISEYIEPEAVGKFASICKSSYHVVKTAKFWFHIYKRYYKEDTLLPVRLRPECMVRLDGLRACVIRALHLMYFSSAEKIGSRIYLQQEEPHSLVSRRCCLMWHKKGKTRWYFYFKLKDTAKRRFSGNRGDAEFDEDGKPEGPDMLETVSANAEEGCRILRVSCLKYGMVPLVMGLTLQTVKVTLSPGFDHHRIQLSFGTSYIPKTPTQVIVLTGVIDLNVFDWWHPCYPHHDVVSSTILEETNESWDLVPADYLTV